MNFTASMRLLSLARACADKRRTVTIPFPQCRIQWLRLILRRIPEHLEVLFGTVSFPIEPPV